MKFRHLRYIFWLCRKDELDNICMMVKAEELHKLLEEVTWIDTNTMYYYFELLRGGCDSCFIADPSVCVSTMTISLSVK